MPCCLREEDRPGFGPSPSLKCAFVLAAAAFLIFFLAATVCFTLAIFPRSHNSEGDLRCPHFFLELFHSRRPLSMHGLIFLVGAFKVRDVVVSLKMPNPGCNFINQ